MKTIIRAFLVATLFLGGLAVAPEVSAASVDAVSIAPEKAQIFCDTPTRLYDLDNYGGASTWRSERWTYLNLVNYGFDNRMESFVTGCQTTMWTGPNGSGIYYAIGANVWNSNFNGANLISSIYIH